MSPSLRVLEKRVLLESEAWVKGQRRLEYRATPVGRDALLAAKEKVRELVS
jgi:DNA-binding PadR family transcriptional regulator